LSWCKVNLICDRNDAHAIEEILVANEAISISMGDERGNNPIYEPEVGETPLWEVVELSALFEEKISMETINSLLQGVPYSKLIIQKLDNQNWIENYQRNFKPIKFGRKLWVIPSWNKNPPMSEIIQLRMDPGMAFGSGSHETTHLCLEYLDENSPNNISVLDYGCGSGILGIAALLLGASEVIAVDIDPQALIAAKENSKVNNVSEKIIVTSPNDLSNLGVKVDFLIANIFSKSLIRLKNEFYNLLNRKGLIVLSGILEEQLDEVITFYESSFELTKVRKKNKWCLIELRKCF
jgi:ribosomal protein L11 methyltransferase